MRRLVVISIHAFWAYKMAVACAAVADRIGLATGLLALFFCLLANQLVAAWLNSR